jgi:hypothetical protein
MTRDISEIDDLANEVKVCIAKADNYADTARQKIAEVAAPLEAGEFGGWTVSRWLLMRVGLGVDQIPLYLPKPREVAAAAVQAAPHKSDRAIAAETGLSHATVSRARATVSFETVQRVGLDGKERRPPAPKSLLQRRGMEETTLKQRKERDERREVQISTLPRIPEPAVTGPVPAVAINHDDDDGANDDGKRLLVGAYFAAGSKMLERHLTDDCAAVVDISSAALAEFEVSKKPTWLDLMEIMEEAGKAAALKILECHSRRYSEEQAEAVAYRILASLPDAARELGQEIIQSRGIHPFLTAVKTDPRLGGGPPKKVRRGARL